MSNLSPDAPADYMALDLSVRSRISVRDWLWMTDEQKAGFEASELEPGF